MGLYEDRFKLGLVAYVTLTASGYNNTVTNGIGGAPVTDLATNTAYSVIDIVGTASGAGLVLPATPGNWAFLSNQGSNTVTVGVSQSDSNAVTIAVGSCVFVACDGVKYQQITLSNQTLDINSFSTAGTLNSTDLLLIKQPAGDGGTHKVTLSTLKTWLGALVPTPVTFLQPANAVSASAINIANAPATFDSYTPVSGTSLILLTGQSTLSQNGLYVWNGAGQLMTRTTDMAAASNCAGVVIPVINGSIGYGSFWYSENQSGADIVGTNALAFLSSPQQMTQIVYAAIPEQIGANGGQSLYEQYLYDAGPGIGTKWTYPTNATGQTKFGRFSQFAAPFTANGSVNVILATLSSSWNLLNAFCRFRAHTSDGYVYDLTFPLDAVYLNAGTVRCAVPSSTGFVTAAVWATAGAAGGGTWSGTSITVAITPYTSGQTVGFTVTFSGTFGSRTLFPLIDVDINLCKTLVTLT